VLAARRSLARALHPDLFAKDPAAQLLATEILKQLNSLADR
jgi:curved DNA-binding protein CbpA